MVLAARNMKKNIPLMFDLVIRGPVRNPHADGAPDPEGFVYLAPDVLTHIAVCAKCRNFLVEKIHAAADEVSRIGSRASGVRL